MLKSEPVARLEETVKGLEIHLKKFYKHCEKTRLCLLEATRVGGEMP